MRVKFNFFLIILILLNSSLFAENAPVAAQTLPVQSTQTTEPAKEQPIYIKHVEKGRDCFTKLNFECSIEEFNTALTKMVGKDDATEIEIRKNLASSYIALNNNDPALIEFIKILNIDPKFQLPRDSTSPRILAVFDWALREHERVSTKSQKEFPFKKIRYFGQYGRFSTELNIGIVYIYTDTAFLELLHDKLVSKGIADGEIEKFENGTAYGGVFKFDIFKGIMAEASLTYYSSEAKGPRSESLDILTGLVGARYTYSLLNASLFAHMLVGASAIGVDGVEESPGVTLQTGVGGEVYVTGNLNLGVAVNTDQIFASQERDYERYIPLMFRIIYTF